MGCIILLNLSIIETMAQVFCKLLNSIDEFLIENNNYFDNSINFLQLQVPLNFILQNVNFIIYTIYIYNIYYPEIKHWFICVKIITIIILYYKCMK